MWGDDVARALGSGDPAPTPILRTIEPEEPLHETIYNRLGFNWSPLERVYTSSGGASTATDPMGWNQVLRMLAEEPSAPPLVQDKYKTPIVDFVAALVSRQSPPRMLWDLSDSNPYPLGTLRRMHDVIIRKSEDKIYYFFEPRNHQASSDQRWILMMSHAAAVLECLRQEIPL